jgi:putative CocE/NonD family hydrolase
MFRLGSFAILVLHGSFAWAQTPEAKDALGKYIRENYTKKSVMVPMRDGVRLSTIIYSPKDTSRSYPMLMLRTPYGIGPYEDDKFRERLGPSDHFAREGYIFVYQDVRGRFLSEGDFVNMRPHRPVRKSIKDIDESTDTYDTIDWLVKNVPNHNGKVGQYGISYPGFYTAAGMIDAHPNLKAASPQAPIADWFFDDFFHHGAFFLPHTFYFFSSSGLDRPKPTTAKPGSFKYPTQDGYKFYLDVGPAKNINDKYIKNGSTFLNQMMQHPTYDEFWKSRNILPHLKNVAPAVMTVGGWYDAEDLYGTFKTYAAIEKQNPGVTNTLVVGPWAHGGWERNEGHALGHVKWGSDTSEYYRKEVELPFFNFHLKGKGELKLPEAHMFETGANRWRSFDAWPPKELKPSTLYLGSKGRLLPTPPQTKDHDAFLSDPRKPVPFIDGIATGMTKEYMTDDQRFATKRPDVLCYQTEPLTEPVTLAGPLRARLDVSTTGTDADWIVKIVDVFPEDIEEKSSDRPMAGYHMHVRSEVIRGRYRNSYEKPEPFKPGEVAHIDLELQDVLHTFKKGHRIMVQVHSTWFPLVDRNPQKYVPNIFFAAEDDYQPAEHRVFRSSRIEFGVLR